MLKHCSQNTYENGINSLTLEDIKNNLKKPLFSDHLDLENVYDFLNTVSLSKGKSGFVTIRQHESRKKSCETLKIEELGNELSISPKVIREKSLISSPALYSSSPKILARKQVIRLKSNEEIKISKVSSPKPIETGNSVSKNFGKILSDSSLKPRIFKELDCTRDRVLSPYGITLQKSSSKLPVLQDGKRRMRVIKFEKGRKKSKAKK